MKENQKFQHSELPPIAVPLVKHFKIDSLNYSFMQYIYQTLTLHYSKYPVILVNITNKISHSPWRLHSSEKT